MHEHDRCNRLKTTIPKKPNQCTLAISEPLLNQIECLAFSFIANHKEPLNLKEKQVSLSLSLRLVELCDVCMDLGMIEINKCGGMSFYVCSGLMNCGKKVVGRCQQHD